MLDDHRRVSALVGRGGGKTTAYKGRALRKMVRIRRARLIYIALSRPHAEELLWEPLMYTCGELGLVEGKDVAFNNTKLKLTILRTGAELQLFGADKWSEIQKQRGKPFHDVAVDEAAFQDNAKLVELIEKIVGPRLGDHRGTLELFSSPGHILSGEFYEATIPGGTRNRRFEDRDKPEYANWLAWSSHAWSLDDPEVQTIPALRNLWAEALITKEERGWSDDHPTWQREYLGRWAADNTTTIFKYDPRINQWDPPRGHGGIASMAVLPPDADGKPRTDWLFGYGLDMGHSDPFALQVFAVSPSDATRTLYHVYEFERPGMYAQTIAQLLLGTDETQPLKVARHEDGKGVIGATGWPAGMVADMTGSGGSVLDELSKVYGVTVLPAEQAKGQRFATVELFNGDLIDGRIRILKGSKLEEQMSALQWEVDEYGQLRWPKGKPDHASDAAIYCRRVIANLFDAPAPTKQERVSAIERRIHAEPEATGGEFSWLLDDDGGGSMDWGNE